MRVKICGIRRVEDALLAGAPAVPVTRTDVAESVVYDLRVRPRTIATSRHPQSISK